MNKFLDDIPLFVEVARQKSFSKAADKLDIGTSTLSRRIRLLEKQMGTLLFYRDTRNVELTDSGKLLLERCEFILSEAQETFDAVVRDMQQPSGLIRICLHTDIYYPHLRNVFSKFAAQWPEIRLNVTFVEHSVDLRTAPYDVAFLVGVDIAAPLVARKLLTVEPFLYTSPDLFKRYPEPQTPEDLHNIPCIALDRFGTHWTLVNGETQRVIKVQPHYTFSTIDLCREFAVAGQGVTMLRKLLALPDEKAGRLVRVLPDWSGPKHDMYLVTGPGQLPKRLRLFIDYMQNFYASLRGTI